MPAKQIHLDKKHTHRAYKLRIHPFPRAEDPDLAIFCQGSVPEVCLIHTSLRDKEPGSDKNQTLA